MKHAPHPWPGNATRKPTIPPFPSTRAAVVYSALVEQMTPEDMAYMARAVLQMSDEIATLRAELRAVQAALMLRIS